MYILGGILFVSLLWVLYKLYNLEIFSKNTEEYDEIEEIFRYSKRDIIIVFNYLQQRIVRPYFTHNQRKLRELIESLDEEKYEKLSNYVAEMTPKDQIINKILSFNEDDIVKISKLLYYPKQINFEMTDEEKKLYSLMSSMTTEEINKLSQKINNPDFTLWMANPSYSVTKPKIFRTLFDNKFKSEDPLDESMKINSLN